MVYVFVFMCLCMCVCAILYLHLCVWCVSLMVFQKEENWREKKLGLKDLNQNEKVYKSDPSVSAQYGNTQSTIVKDI